MPAARVAPALSTLSAGTSHDERMRIFSEHPALRWAVPGVAAVAVVGAGSVSGIVTASADTGLPHRSASQLLADVQQARLDGLSGTVVQKADLGLPDLSMLDAGGSGPGGGSSSDLSSLITGTHTMRIWYAGPQQARMALLGTLGESDVIRNGRDVWVWSSKGKSAVHYTVPADLAKAEAEGKAPNAGPSSMPTSPQQAADQALAAITPSTRVTTSGTATVAGRAAYELVLKPKASSSLVSQVRIAIDAERHIPLQVQVYSTKGGGPALQIGFSSIDFGKPDSGQFAFNPPPGTTVTHKSLPMSGAMTTAPGMPKGLSPQAAGKHAFKTVGDGWGTVLVGRSPLAELGNAGRPGAGKGMGDAGEGSPSLGVLLHNLPKVSGKWGSGRLLSSRLVSVLLTDDGRVVAGAVTPQALYAALGK